MARRTKVEALETRTRLLDAAERLFQAKGVTSTTLGDIATAAGTTRGAVYHHFKDKADLFNAMMERVTLPMEDALAEMAKDAGEQTEPLQSLRQVMLHALHQIAHDERTRRVFEVAMQKVERTDEMRAVHERHVQVLNECQALTRTALREAAHRQGGALSIALPAATLGLHALIDGLIHNWLLEPEAFDLVRIGRQTLDAYLRGLGFELPWTRPAGARAAQGRARSGGVGNAGRRRQAIGEARPTRPPTAQNT